MTYYQILDISVNASTEEVVSAFKKLAKQYHPDKNKSPDSKDKFIAIYEAYSILVDPEKRKKYDIIISETTQTFSNNNQFSKIVKEAKEDGAKFANEKYTKAVYKILSAAKYGIWKTIGFFITLITGVFFQLLLRFGPIILIGFIVWGVYTCSVSTTDFSMNKKHHEIYYDLFSNIQNYSNSFEIGEENYSLRGKKVLLIENDSISKKFYEIPEANKPVLDSEIDYILQCESSRKLVGQYSDGAKGYRIDYHVKVIDYRKKKQVGTFIVEGTDPPKTKKTGGDQTGIDNLIWYLEIRFL